LSEECVPVLPKETMKAGLATLGLVDEDHPSISSFALINSSLVKVKYFSLTWKGINIDIADILFSDLVSLNFIESIKEARSRVQDLTSGEIVSLNLLSRTRKLGHSTMELRSLIS
ncbi:hypothetical protein Tco_1130972, partial [Tanacetum coccineum]